MGIDKYFQHLIVIAINEHLINLVAFKSDFTKEGSVYPESKWVKEVSGEEILETYEDFSEETKDLFKVSDSVPFLVSFTSFVLIVLG